MNALGDPAVALRQAEPAGSMVQVRQLVGQYPGAAILFDEEGLLLLCNDHARRMGGGASLEPGLFADTVRACAGDYTPRARRQRVGAGDTARTFDVSYMPMTVSCGGPVVLVLARDVSFESNLNHALIASRSLLKDLVSCSADFSWQTDAAGRFSFVSPRGALALPAAALVGRQSCDFLADRQPGETSPFRCAAALNDGEYWLKAADGKILCMRISALPVFTANGAPDGTRGVCREITEQKRQEQALAEARGREATARAIVDAIRNTFDPAEMLDTALSSLAPAAAASHAWIVRGIAPATEIAAAYDAADDDAASPPDRLLPGLSGEGEQLIAAYHDGRHFVSLACGHRYHTQGWLILAWRRGEQPPPGAVILLRDVAGQIGIALAQAAAQETLERLSSVDELTGLLNRRAFKELAGQRIAHHRRFGRSGAMLYIDLDNFKPVNDTHGHEIGDTVLRLLGDLLRGPGTRASNLAGRLGGDEFVVWLEETDLDGALRYGENLLAEAAGLLRYSASKEAPLTLSIGVAGKNPDDGEDIDRLIVRADQAMYQAKRAGKGRVVLAPACAD